MERICTACGEFFKENACRSAQILYAVVDSARYKFFMLIQIEKQWIELLKGLSPGDFKAIPSIILCEFLVIFFYVLTRVSI